MGGISLFEKDISLPFPRSLQGAGNKRPACKRRRAFLITFWKKRCLLVHAALTDVPSYKISISR